MCISNDEYRASLEHGKIYICLHDRAADLAGMLRVIDESGDDYLYPKTSFEQIKLPAHLAKALWH